MKHRMVGRGGTLYCTRCGVRRQEVYASVTIRTTNGSEWWAPVWRNAAGGVLLGDPGCIEREPERYSPRRPAETTRCPKPVRDRRPVTAKIVRLQGRG